MFLIIEYEVILFLFSMRHLVLLIFEYEISKIFYHICFIIKVRTFKELSN